MYGIYLQVTLEPSSFTEEKFALYCAYQKEIHNDDDKSASGFKRFLIENPLVVSSQRVIRHLHRFAHDQPPFPAPANKV